MRLVLASSALLIIWIDPSEPDRFVTMTYGALILYVVYSLLLYLVSNSQSSPWRWLRSWAHWLDVAWYTALIALSSGTSSIFFFFYFFSVLVASFRWGFVSGLRVTLASALLFASIGYAATPDHPNLELNRSLLRPVYLIVLGYMMAYWGGFELTLKRRLELLKDVSTLSNPRFGVEQTINLLMQRLRTFFGAKSCFLVLAAQEPGTYRLRRTDDRASGGIRTEHLTTELARPLLAIPAEHALLYGAPGWWTTKAGSSAYKVSKDERVTADSEASEKLANTFEARSFISVPLRYRNQFVGRVFFTRSRAFNETDVDFLIQAMTHIMPLIENIRLVDRMASDAALEERQTIARDIHDSVIQPYIGLQLGLAGINEKLNQGGFDVQPDVVRLLQGTKAEINDLRGYIHGLREVSRKEGYFLSAVQRFAQRYAEMTGISIAVKAEKDFRIKDRLAAEAFQIVAEALSNVRRHTKSTSVSIEIERQNHCFVMEIENNVPEPWSPIPSFTPKSIAGRAEALGGQVRIDILEGKTRVTIEIPL